MDELHLAHQGISAIKAVAPFMCIKARNRYRCGNQCEGMCYLPAKSTLPVKQISWPDLEQLWDHIHIDHAAPFERHMLLITIDAKRKWLEVAPVPNTSSSASQQYYKVYLLILAYQKSLDNGSGFSNAEFANFLSNDDITHIKIAPYHPRSNRLAECAVQAVKAALKKCH